jgi:hypothetical protein
VTAPTKPDMIAVGGSEFFGMPPVYIPLTRTTILRGGERIINHHAAGECRGPTCPIHRVSDHHMRTWPQHFRGDRGLMERICPHGVGHPDPDDPTTDTVHGCCGCCWTPEEKPCA